MRKLLITTVVGSIRQGRKSLAVAEYLHARVQEKTELATRLLDLADYPLPPLEERAEGESTLPMARKLLEQLGEADGLLIVSPEYKGGVPGALKNVFDYFPPGLLRHKPVGICTVSAGGYGGISCLAQLRLLMLAVGGIPIPEFIAVSKVNEVASERTGLEKIFAGKLEAFFAELIWHCEAMAQQRERVEARRPT
jgi:NAD(P)H-dependent FMN reductase